MSEFEGPEYEGLSKGMVPIGKTYDSYNTAISDLTDKHGPDWKNFQGDSAECIRGRQTVLDAMVEEMIRLGLYYVRNGPPVWEKESNKERRKKLRARLDNWIAKPQKSIKAPESSTSGSTTASVSSQSVETTTESEPMVDLATGMSKLSIDGESMNWSDSPVSQERLDLLVGTIEGNPKAYKYLVQQAGDSQDKSAAQINGAIQIFLDQAKGKARAYKQLRQFYKSKDRHLFIEPEEIATLVKHVAVQKNPDLQDHTVTNPSFLIGQGKRGPQPTHTDTKQPVLGVKPEQFSILLLTEGGAPGTISYDMEGIPASPTIEDLTELWSDAPKGLLKKIGDTPEAVELIRGYGQLLWASADKRVEPGVVPQYSCKILAGSHPHCAPASVDGKKRTVLFFVLQPPDEGQDTAAASAKADDDDEFYDGETQVSKEKLVFLLYETLLGKYGYVGLKCEETNFLLDKFVEFVSDSAKLGARDLTFNLPDNLKLSLDQIWGKATDAQAAKQALAKGEQALAKLRENSESADAQLASTKGHVVAAFHGSDFLDGVADEKKTPE